MFRASFVGIPYSFIESFAHHTHTNFNLLLRCCMRLLVQDWGLDGLDEISPESIKDRCKVFINGDWAGCFDEAETLCNTLKEIRRKGHIRNDTSIVRDIINRVRVSGLRFRV